MVITQFDERFYFAQRPDVEAAGVPAKDHYDAFGWRELSNPNAGFDTFYYLATNPDVLTAGANPFQHFIEYGIHGGRSANAQSEFDSYFYFTQRPDVLAAILNGTFAGTAEDHYNAHGWIEGSDPNAQFDTSYYLNTHTDVAAAGVNPFWHFAEYGSIEGRSIRDGGQNGGGDGGGQGITIDGSLADWSTVAPLVAPAPTPDGYAVYGSYQGNEFIVAVQAPTGATIGANTTLWFNTDGDRTTGFQIFGNSGGAEYNINFDGDGVPALYTGDAGATPVLGAPALQHAFSPDGTVLEIALPSTLVGGVTAAELFADVNNTVFLPEFFSVGGYMLGDDSILT